MEKRNSNRKRIMTIMLTKCNLYVEYYSHIGFRVLIIGNITLVEDDTILRKISHE